MLLRKTCFLLLVAVCAISAQSIDEEERVHVGEGSANAMTDDEDSDMEGSSLPPDTYYATTPQLRQKFVSSTKMETTTKAVTFTTTDRIVTSARNVIEVTTSSDSRPPVPSEGTSRLFGFQGVFIVLGIIMGVLIILIAVIIVFKARNNKKQAYRPGQRESPDALLKE
uniref:Podoplanin n=1 Tax=Caenorhabditis tropicalis TaxID=1561998 RepID=A0A1I7U158_9PELO